MNILFITYDKIDAPCPRYRAFWPAKGLAQIGNSTRVNLLHDCSKEDIKWADVVIFERIAEALAYETRSLDRIKHALKIISLWNLSNLRKVTGYDLDDYIFFQDDEFNFYNMCTWIQEILLKKSSYVTASTQFLTDKIKRYNSAVFQLPNSIDIEHISHVEPREEKKTVTLGWICGHTHHRDEQIAINIIEPLITKYGERIRFLFVGSMLSKMLDLVDRYSTFITLENYCHWEQLPHVHNAIDINLVPLIKCPLNQGKSVVHYMESGVLKIPSVCSKIGEYQHVIKDGYNGFLADNTQEWLHKLEMLIENPVLRKEMGERAFQDVTRNRTIRIQAEMYSRYLHTIHLPSVKDRMKRIISANVYIMIRLQKVIILFLISLSKVKLSAYKSFFLEKLKKRIKRVAIYLAIKSKVSSPPVLYERSWYGQESEEEIFRKLDEINKHTTMSNNSLRIIFYITTITFIKRIEPIITLANGLVERDYSVIIVSSKKISKKIAMYVNPYVELRETPPESEAEDVCFPQEECCEIIENNSLITIDPYIFTSLGNYKKISSYHDEYVLGYLGGSNELLLDLYSRLRKHYQRIRFVTIRSSRTKKPLPRNHFNEIQYESPENLVRFYSNIDVFILFDQKKEIIQTVLEAMSCGTPVICSTLCNVFIEDSEGIVFFDHGKNSHLIENIVDILENHKRREHLIREGLKYVQRFNTSPLIEHFEAIIRKRVAYGSKISKPE